MIVVHLSSGAAVSFIRLAGDKATLSSPLSSPPGSTLNLVAFEVREADAPETRVHRGEFQLKISRCRKVDDLFLLDGRVRNAQRELLSALREQSAPRAQELITETDS